MKKTLITLGLGAALVFGTAPAALAAGNSETAVKMKTDVSQIDVSVPLELPMTADVNGGALKAVPSADKYMVVNKSSVKVKVESVQGAVTTANDWAIVTEKPAADTTSSAAYGDVCLKLMKSDNSTTDGVLTVGTTKVNAPTSWEVPAKSADVDGELALVVLNDDATVSTVKGSGTTRINKVVSDTNGINALTLTYVISPVTI